MKKTIFIILMLILLFGNFFLTVIVTERYLSIKKAQVKGDYTVRINKENIIVDESDGLKYFYEPKPNSTEDLTPDWLGYSVTTNMNNDGFNDSINYDINKEEDVYRIIVLGDSHTYGVFVGTEENYPALLEVMLNSKLDCPKYKRFEVINLGVHGYDLMYSYKRFRRRGIKYNPDAVLWFVNNWNLVNIDEYFFSRRDELLKEGYKDFNVEDRQFEVSKKAIEELETLYGMDNILDYQKKVFKGMLNIYHGNIIIVSYKDLAKNLEDLIENQSLINNKLHNYILPLDMSFGDKYFFLDGHPNREGHKFIANEMFDILHKSLLNDCQIN